MNQFVKQSYITVHSTANFFVPLNLPVDQLVLLPHMFTPLVMLGSVKL